MRSCRKCVDANLFRYPIGFHGVCFAQQLTLAGQHWQAVSQSKGVQHQELLPSLQPPAAPGARPRFQAALLIFCILYVAGMP